MKGTENCRSRKWQALFFHFSFPAVSVRYRFEQYTCISSLKLMHILEMYQILGLNTFSQNTVNSFIAVLLFNNKLPIKGIVNLNRPNLYLD